MQLLIRTAAIAAGLLGQASAWGDATLPGAAPPPEAEAVAVHLPRGGRTTIELRGHYGGSNSIRFWIVRPPAHGKLSELRDSGDNHAEITYTHDGDHNEARDAFTYIVQGGGRVSSAAEVQITLDEPPPRLRAPSILDFGQVMAGASVTRALTIGNEGGGVVEGHLAVSGPWRSASPDYRVASGETETIAIDFQPDEVKDFSGQITLTGTNGDQTTVSLGGSATAPLHIAPDPLSLVNERRATVFLTNLTEQTMILNFKASAHFQPIGTIELGPKEDGDITVELLPGARPPLHETITIVGVHFTMPLPVDVVAPGPKSGPAQSARPSAPPHVSASPAPIAQPRQK